MPIGGATTKTSRSLTVGARVLSPGFVGTNWQLMPRLPMLEDNSGKSSATNPITPQRFARSAWLMLLLGNKEEAIREGQRAVELMPTSKSAIDGAMMIQYLAVIYAWTGDKDRAIERLTESSEAAREPCDLWPSASPIRSGTHCGATRALKQSSLPSRQNIEQLLPPF